MSGFTSKQGKLLVQLARQTIGEKLGRPQSAAAAADLEQQLNDDIFQAHRACFVTLTIADRLRGCIGSLAAVEPLTVNIEKNAINAAFHDPRFKPLSAAEFEQAAIEISVLSEPRTLEYSGRQDLLRKLRPGVDGVIIRKDNASATFLPQVWEQLPEPHQFMTHLCTKAGLSPRAWQDSDLEVKTYQVQYFKEDH
jgi:AmmeMemoRadiSam system protein A